MKKLWLLLIFLLCLGSAIAQTAFTWNPLYGRWDASQLSPGIVQSGYPLVLTTTSSSGTTYTATASPTLTAYTKDQILTWDVGATGCTAGAVTMNIDGLGAKSVFESDGVTNPVAADCAANQIVRIAYDGTAFRIVGGGGAVAASGAVLVNQANTAGASFTLDASAASGTIGFKTPVAAGAAPTANGALSYDSTANGFVGGVNGVSKYFPIATKLLTISGPTAARTITVPDANFTAARTDAANTFTGHQTIEGVTSTGATGTGKFVFDANAALGSPTLNGTPVFNNPTIFSAQWQQNGTLKFLIGAAFGASDWSPGTAAGDTVFRTQGGNIFVTTDSGTTSGFAFKNGNTLSLTGITLDRGTAATYSGCATITPVSTGATAGRFTTTTTGTCTVTITMNGATGLTAPNLWLCYATDVTAGHLVDFTQSGTLSATACTLSGATTSGDTVVWHAIGY